MKIITSICVLLLLLGLALGWWLWGDLTGGAIGLFVTGCLAVPLYWLSNMFARHTARTAMDAGKLDASRSPQASYDRLSDSGVWMMNRSEVD